MTRYLALVRAIFAARREAGLPVGFVVIREERPVDRDPRRNVLATEHALWRADRESDLDTMTRNGRPLPLV